MLNLLQRSAPPAKCRPAPGSIWRHLPARLAPRRWCLCLGGQSQVAVAAHHTPRRPWCVPRLRSKLLSATRAGARQGLWSPRSEISSPQACLCSWPWPLFKLLHAQVDGGAHDPPAQRGGPACSRRRRGRRRLPHPGPACAARRATVVVAGQGLPPVCHICQFWSACTAGVQVALSALQHKHACAAAHGRQRAGWEQAAAPVHPAVRLHSAAAPAGAPRSLPSFCSGLPHMHVCGAGRSGPAANHWAAGS